MKLTDLGKEYENWKQTGYPGAKEETKIFLAHLFDQKRQTKLWKHQAEALLKTIYSFEILGKNNLLLNIVTGGGKTAIIGGCIAWLKISHSMNKFLILVPNTIVRDRLERDFRPQSNEQSVFQKFPKLCCPDRFYLSLCPEPGALVQ